MADESSAELSEINFRDYEQAMQHKVIQNIGRLLNGLPRILHAP